jgi:DNA-directed RNA polymerase specialized sigma24 family protein
MRHTPTGSRDSLLMSIAMPGSPTPPRALAKGARTNEADDGAALGHPDVRRFLRDYVKKRVGADDVDDVVQTVLLDALASPRRPREPSEVRRWLVGIARHKCADVHRRAGRERLAVDELPDLPAGPPPVEERALVRWAEEQARGGRDADRTLGWMAREGEGDKLEHIAEDEALPPARVRQRVSRMRRLLKERWLAELALVAALGAVALVLWRWLHREDGPIVADPTTPPTVAPVESDPLVEGRRVREAALEACRAGEHRLCLDGLDRARALDPRGDAADEVRDARERAAAALEPVPERSAPDDAAPLPEPSAAPQTTTPPTSKAPPPPRDPAPTNVAPRGPSPTSAPPTSPPPQQQKRRAPPSKSDPVPKKPPSKSSFDDGFGSKR